MPKRNQLQLQRVAVELVTCWDSCKGVSYVLRSVQRINVDDDEENFNEEINLQDDKYDDNIDLDGDDQVR